LSFVRSREQVNRCRIALGFRRRRTTSPRETPGNHRWPGGLKYGDACNIPPLSELPKELEFLARLYDCAGGDYDAIEKTASLAFDVGAGGSKVPELLGRLR